MSGMGFMPATITVNAGEKVIWKNSSQIFHNVVAVSYTHLTLVTMHASFRLPLSLGIELVARL